MSGGITREGAREHEFPLVLLNISFQILTSPLIKVYGGGGGVSYDFDVDLSHQLDVETGEFKQCTLRKITWCNLPLKAYCKSAEK